MIALDSRSTDTVQSDSTFGTSLTSINSNRNITDAKLAMDLSQIGRYGTISLMKRQPVDSVVAAFGIDSEQLTFGRDPTCSVRLYYPDVSLVHCKIVFEERKASNFFLYAPFTYCTPRLFSLFWEQTAF